MSYGSGKERRRSKVEIRQVGSEGTVDEVHKEDVEKTVQGTKIKRKGSSDEPALIIKQGDKKVVKSASEVTKK